MPGNTISGSGLLGAEIAAAFPHFDPFVSRTQQKAARRLILLSLALHLILLALFRDALLGIAVEQEETIVVRMLEEKEPQPEPPKLKRKVLARRRIDASVVHFKEVAQPEIRRVMPVPVLDQTRKVEVDPTELSEAPKRIENREVVTESISVFAEVPTQVQPIQVDRVNPEVRRVRVGRASAGPRKLEAAGPVVSSRPVDIEAPVVAKGELSRNAVTGSAEGARIAALTSGVSDRLFEGTGESGLLSGIEKDCHKDAICQAYLKLIRDRVYGRWHIPPDVDSGEVVLSFRIDRGGSAHRIQLRRADDQTLGATCLAAFRHASPFPPPPKQILYIINKKIRANFDYGK